MCVSLSISANVNADGAQPCSVILIAFGWVACQTTETQTYKDFLNLNSNFFKQFRCQCVEMQQKRTHMCSYCHWCFFAIFVIFVQLYCSAASKRWSLTLKNRQLTHKRINKVRMRQTSLWSERDQSYWWKAQFSGSWGEVCLQLYGHILCLMNGIIKVKHLL